MAYLEKLFVKFVVRKDGKVEIPDTTELLHPWMEQRWVKWLWSAYRPTRCGCPAPDEKYIELLKKEAIRVVTSSPDWEPGKVDGKPVDVMFTFPINFVLQ